jgi:putative (di)nucleoside polyphosphate hydrolase
MAEFRKNVCVVVRNARSGLLLVCHRKGFPRDSGWQFPQGGLHKGKDIILEMRRELREEIGTDNVKFLACTPKKYTYFFPQGVKRRHGGYSGQTQQWVLTEFSGDDGEINFNRKPAEFDAFEWVSASTAYDRIIDFKKKVYKEAMRDLELFGTESAELFIAKTVQH